MATTKGGLIKQATEQKQVAPQQQTLKGIVAGMEGQIARALPPAITPERFTRIVLTTLSSNPQLQKCTPNSFLGAMMTAAQLGLEVNSPLGESYLIAYRNKGQLECQFQLGYKGLLSLAYRGGMSSVSCHEVYENDTFEYELGLTPKLKHIPALKDRGEVILVYATYHTKDGGFGFEVMSMDDIRRHRDKFSKAANSSFSPWSTSPIEMAKKTVVKSLLKLAPLAAEQMKAVATDETIKSSISENMTDLNDETVIDITPEGATVNTETGEIIEEDIPFEGSLND